MAGKTARMQRELDAWLVAHPGKKALIIDPKGGSAWRWFEPHLQIAEHKEDGMGTPVNLTPQNATLDMSEEFLAAYAGYLKQLRENEPGKTFMLKFSLDLSPAGKGKPPDIAVYEIDDKGRIPERIGQAEGIRQIHDAYVEQIIKQVGLEQYRQQLTWFLARMCTDLAYFSITGDIAPTADMNEKGY